MRNEERVDTYLTQLDVQMHKMFYAYAKLVSYYSKLTRNPELSEICESSEDNQKRMEKTMQKVNYIIKRMDQTRKRSWEQYDFKS